MRIKAGTMHFEALNKLIKYSEDKQVTIEECIGQRYIGSGLVDKDLTIHGTPGNALGCYLDGSNIHVHGNTQEATGDTMNEGAIYIHGSAGDATGYAMRGGKIFVKGDAGYRAGIHMKAYEEKKPVLIIGGRAGSFLGEYQAGGNIVVLGIGCKDTPVGHFCGTGMHGGKIYLRTESLPYDLPKQVVATKATEEDLAEIRDDVYTFCKVFGGCVDELLDSNFYVLKPDTKNPYKQLYTYN